MPLIGYHTDGDVVTFLLMLFVGEPLLVTVAYRAFMLVLLPITLATTSRTDS